MILENADCIIINDTAEIKDLEQRQYMRSAGVYRLATELRKNNYKVQVIECFSYLSEQEIDYVLERCIGKNTLFVGLNTTYLFNWVTMKTAYTGKFLTAITEKIKKLNPNTKTLVGGHNPYLFINYVDCAIFGLADNAIVEYAKFLENKNPFFRYRIENHKMIVDGDSYHKVFNFRESVNHYQPEDNLFVDETLALEVSRGCIFKCKFCAYPLIGRKNNDYVKDMDVLKEEIIRNYNEYGISKYVYGDDTHNDNNTKLIYLANLAQKLPFKLEYSCYIRIDLLRANPIQYSLLKDGGMIGATIGVESLNHRSAKAIGKGLAPEKTIDEIYKFNQKLPHVGLCANFIVGLPYETKESVKEWTNIIAPADFPVDMIGIRPLYINRNPQKAHKSEFEVSSDKYYTWDDEYTWNNGNFNLKWSQDFCKEFNSLIRDRQRFGGFSSTFLRKYNKTLIKDLPLGIREKFIEDYKKKLLDS